MKKIIRLITACGFVLLFMGLTACTQSTGENRDLRSPHTAADINARLGLGYLLQGKYDIAMDKLKRALYFDPDLPQAHHYIAELYSRLGQNDLAEQHFKRALDRDGANPSLNNNYGAFLCGINRIDESEKYFKRALDNPLYKVPDETYENMGVCALRKPDKVKAEAHFRKALQLNPKLPTSLYHMAKLSFDEGNHIKTRAYLQRYREVAQPRPETLWLGIQNERILGDKDTVASYSLLLKSRFPDSEETRLLIESEKK